MWADIIGYSLINSLVIYGLYLVYFKNKKSSSITDE